MIFDLVQRLLTATELLQLMPGYVLSRSKVLTQVGISYVFISHPASDLFGRRYAALTGILIVAVGNAFECGATGPGAYAMMIAGRIISGIGVGMLSTSVPLYQRYLTLFPNLTTVISRQLPLTIDFQRGCSG